MVLDLHTRLTHMIKPEQMLQEHGEKLERVWYKHVKGKRKAVVGKQPIFLWQLLLTEGQYAVKQYHSKLTGEMFAKFIRDHFSAIFASSANPRGKLFLQDGDPRQCSKVAHVAMDCLGCKMFAIPPCSPDINPIEIIFYLVCKQLGQDALRNKIERVF